MAKFKRQHYLSQFYLRGFIDAKYAPKFWMFDKKNPDKVVDVSPADVAFQKWYYAFERTDGTINRDTYELMFQQMEDIIAPCVKQILQREHYNNEDRTYVAIFMSLSMLRVPYFRDNIKKNIESQLKAETLWLAKDKDRFEREMRALEKEKGESLGNLDDLRRKWLEGKYTIEVDAHRSLEMLRHSLQPLAKEIFNHRWHFLTAPTNRKFITGDNPLVYINPQNKLLEQDGIGLWTDGVEITFPLSKDIVIFATPKNKDDRYVNINANKVDEINRRIILSAYRFIFAGKPSNAIARLVKKYCDVRPILVEEHFDKKDGILSKQYRKIAKQPLTEPIDLEIYK